MVKVLVEFSTDADIIECPTWIVKQLEAYQGKFLEWLFDKKNDHLYWTYKNGEKYGCKYRSQAFVGWLNKFVLGNCKEKANVLEECVGERGYICRVIYPKDIEDMLEDKKWDFAEWLQLKNKYGNSRDQKYIKIYGERRYQQYAVADWINKFILKESNEKAYVIEKQVNLEEMKDMPRINF